MLFTVSIGRIFRRIHGVLFLGHLYLVVHFAYFVQILFVMSYKSNPRTWKIIVGSSELPGKSKVSLTFCRMGKYNDKYMPNYQSQEIK